MIEGRGDRKRVKSVGDDLWEGSISNRDDADNMNSNIQDEAVRDSENSLDVVANTENEDGSMKDGDYGNYEEEKRKGGGPP